MNLDSVLPDLEAVIRWVGVVVGMAGAVLSSPDGTKRLFKNLWTWFWRLFRRKGEAHHGSLRLFGEGSLSITDDVASELDWTDDTPLGRRTEILRSRIVGLNMLLVAAEARLGERLNQHDGKLAELQAAIESAEATLHRRIDTNEEKAARIDAAGLPVIGLGIALSGISKELAAFWPLGVPIALVSIGVSVFVLVISIKSGAWSDKRST